jgi:hypothetical protein
MRKLYIHCGLPKTGTTSIQRFFSSERKKLRALGIEYPEIGLNDSGIAHHSVAEQLNRRAEFNGDAEAVGGILNYLRAPDRQPTVVLSSEGFATCLYNKRTQGRFIGFLRSARKLNDHVSIVFRIRPFSQYFDSWYIQRLKRGSVSVDVHQYIHESRRWVRNFFRSLKAVKDTFGRDCIIIIDTDEGGGDAVAALLARIGVADMMPVTNVPRHNERLGLKKAALIYQLQLLANAAGQDAEAELAPLRTAIVRSKDFPEDIYRYRVIPIAEANRIQLTARNCTMPFLKEFVAYATEPEPEIYEAVSLADTVLSTEDSEFLGELFPAEFQSGRLLDAWRKGLRHESSN